MDDSKQQTETNSKQKEIQLTRWWAIISSLAVLMLCFILTWIFGFMVGGRNIAISIPNIIPPTITPTPLETPGVSAANFAGTGYLSIEAGGYPSFHFRPKYPIQFQSIKSITVHLVPVQNLSGSTTLQFYYLHQSGEGWRMMNLQWGDNKVDYPYYSVRSDGSIYTAVRNWGQQTVEIRTLSLTLVVIKADGAEAVYDATH